MKQSMITIMTAGLFLVFASAQSQEKQHKGMDPSMRTHMMEMMKDSSMIDMMMDHIASDSHMRMGMLRKMMHNMKSDTPSMMEDCKTMMDDKKMQCCMMEKMDGKTMKHDMMHEKSSDSNSKEKEKDDGHEDHHNNQG